MKSTKSGKSGFLAIYVSLIVGAIVLFHMGRAEASPTKRFYENQLFNCSVEVGNGQGLKEEFRSLIFSSDSADATFQCKQSTYIQCLDLAERMSGSSKVFCKDPIVSLSSGSIEKPKINTFCRKSSSTLNSELVVVRDGKLGEVILETLYASQCTNARDQLKENGRCFCGKPSTTFDTSLICLDQMGKTENFGNFVNESQCIESLKQILEGFK